MKFNISIMTFRNQNSDSKYFEIVLKLISNVYNINYFIEYLSYVDYFLNNVYFHLSKSLKIILF